MNSYQASKTDPLVAASNRGMEIIGVAQAAIAFTAVADLGGGEVQITAAAHGLKKRQTIFIDGGDYGGIHAVKRVTGANTFVIDATFTATAAGDLEKTASLNGMGFTVDAVPVTIAEFEAENQNQDVAAVIAKEYAVGDYVPIPFKRIRITAGDISCIRNHPQTGLAYSNR